MIREDIERVRVVDGDVIVFAIERQSPTDDPGAPGAVVHVGQGTVARAGRVRGHQTGSVVEGPVPDGILRLYCLAEQAERDRDNKANASPASKSARCHTTILTNLSY